MMRVRSLALTLLVSLASPMALAQDASPLSPQQQEQVKALVRQVIQDNPELVLEALQSLERKQELAQQQRSRDAIASYRDRLERDPADPVHGNPKGDVTIVEFFDYNCPYCKMVAERVMRLAEADGNIRLVFKEYPILGPVSAVAARAALAAQKQGKYAAYHRALMGLRGRLDEAAIFTTAAEVGLNVDRLKADMNSPDIADHIRATLELGRAIGATGTPAFVIGKTLVPGAVDDATLKQLVADTRAGK